MLSPLVVGFFVRRSSVTPVVTMEQPLEWLLPPDGFAGFVLVGDWGAGDVGDAVEVAPPADGWDDAWSKTRSHHQGAEPPVAIAMRNATRTALATLSPPDPPSFWLTAAHPDPWYRPER